MQRRCRRKTGYLSFFEFICKKHHKYQKTIINAEKIQKFYFSSMKKIILFLIFLDQTATFKIRIGCRIRKKLHLVYQNNDKYQKCEIQEKIIGQNRVNQVYAGICSGQALIPILTKIARKIEEIHTGRKEEDHKEQKTTINGQKCQKIVDF